MMTASLKKRRRQIETVFSQELKSLWDQVNITTRLNHLIAESLGQNDPIHTQYSNSNLAEQLQSLGSDSLSTVRLLSLVNSEFQRDIPLQILQSASSVDDVALYLQPNSNSSHSPSLAYQKDLQASFEMKQQVMLPHNIPSIDEAQHILLTGATGLIGSNLLSILLKKTDATVSCIVRRRSSQETEDESKQRLLYQLSSYCSLEITQTEENRIKIICLDLQDEMWSLAQDLESKIDFVIHSAAIVNWVQSYHSVRNCNVLSTMKLLEFCTKKRVKPFLFISTLGATGTF